MAIICEDIKYSDKQEYVLSTAVVESFKGKSKELLEAERLCGKIIDVVKEEFNTGKPKLIDGKDITNSKIVRDLEVALAKAVGCKSVALSIHSSIQFGSLMVGISAATGEYDNRSSDEIRQEVINALLYGGRVNACAFTSSFATLANKLTFNKGFTRKDMHCSVYVDKTLLWLLDATPGELLAIILHEIGHSLDTSWSLVLSHCLPSLRTILSFPETLFRDIINTFVIQGVVTTVIRAIAPLYMRVCSELTKRIPEFDRIMGMVMNIVTQISGVLGFVNMLDRAKRKGFQTPKEYILSIFEPSNFFGYYGEKYADSFATAYGYGPETASFHLKLEKQFRSLSNSKLKLDVVAENNPTLACIYNFMAVSTKIPFLFTDEHPDYTVRVYAQLRKLRRELKNPDVPQKIRDEITDQIKQLEKIIEDASDITKGREHGAVATAMWNKVMFEFFKGRADPRELASAILSHEE